MRLIFGVLSLLVVLAIVGTVGKKQFEALGMGRGAAPSDGSTTGAPAAGNVAAQSRSIQNHVKGATASALQQGADRAASAP